MESITHQTNVKIESSWKLLLQEEFSKPYFLMLADFLKQEKKNGEVIYPPGSEIFAAFELTPVESVKAVIIGQDPYHGAGQAHGLCFSVRKGVPVPPSLQNIFKELHSDLGINIPIHGNLEGWAKQGVLMLNATLTVRANRAASHQKKGWEQFTDAVIRELIQTKQHIVYLLWGNYAKEKGAIIPRDKNLVLTAAHPSPLARGAFNGCKHFSQTNQYLIQSGRAPIDWSAGLT